MSEPKHYYTRGNRVPDELLSFGDYAYRDASRTLVIESVEGSQPTVLKGEPLTGTIALNYDDDGRLTSVGGNGVISTFSYNPDGSLLSVNNGFSEKIFNYNPDGSLQNVTTQQI